MWRTESVLTVALREISGKNKSWMGIWETNLDASDLLINQAEDRRIIQLTPMILDHIEQGNIGLSKARLIGVLEGTTESF